MSQDLNSVTLIVVGSNFIIAIVSAALLLLIFWQNSQGRINQLFAFTMLSLNLYSIFNIVNRFNPTLGINVEFMTYIVGSFYALFLIGLFFATVEFANLRNQFIFYLKIVFIVGFIYSMIITWTGLGNNEIQEVTNQRGSYRTDLTSIGFSTIALNFFFPLITTIILFRVRQKAPRLRHLWLAPLLVLLGLVWLAFLWNVTLIPLNAVLLVAAALILGRAVLSENLLNPLAELSQELQKKNAELIEAAQIKNRFLAKMSHELRTPLNSIIGYTDLILDGLYGDLSPQQQDRLEKVIRNGRNLLNLINDILDLSRIETGQLILEPVVVNTSEMIENAIQVVQPDAEAKNLEIRREFTDVPATLVDAKRMGQILTNILSNAVKFTHEGHIRIVATSQKDMVQFMIEDTGIGIAENQIADVFEAFRQIDNTATRQYGGTGLGMNITKQLIEMSGGNIWLESVVDAGTTFYFTLPRAGTTPVSQVSQAQLKQANMDTSLKVLIIDDQHDAQMYARDAILAVKPLWDVIIAENGRDGIQKAIKTRPDIITLDIMMPSMDGWEVLKKLKNDPRISSIPVIILSHVDHRDLAFKLGASATLTKPVTKHDLVDTLEHVAYSTA